MSDPRPAARRAVRLRRGTADVSRLAPNRIPRRLAGEAIPLSFGQEQIWLHGLLAPDMPLYTESLTIHRRGTLDRGALVASFRDVVRRHEIWRTMIEWTNGGPVQHVHEDAAAYIEVADVRHLPESDREGEALRLARQDLDRPFDLTRETGVRARLVTLSDTDHRMFLCLHHLIFDGISIYGVVLPELVALYDGYVAGSPAGLDDPPLQYGDFACWERRNVDEPAVEACLGYWRRQLAGASPLIAIRADRPRPDRQSFRGRVRHFGFSPELTAAARATALREECSIFMVLLASFAVACHRWSGQTDLVVGSVSGGRDRPELGRIVGYFLRTLAIRVDLSSDPTFREILVRVRAALVDALGNAAVPFQRLVRTVTRERDLSRSPLFQVTFSIEPAMPDVGPEWDLSEMDAGTAVSKFDLSVELEDREDIVRGRAIYSTDLFDDGTIAELIADWSTLLERATSDPGQRLRDLAAAEAATP